MSKPEMKRRAKEAGSHFFDRDAMRFFASRMETDGFEAPAGTLWFITSEQYVSDKGNGPRKYTIHKVSILPGGYRPGWNADADAKHGALEFQAHATKAEALDVMHELMSTATQAATLAGISEIGGTRRRSSSSKKAAPKPKKKPSA
jgi:hypothetical protein